MIWMLMYIRHKDEVRFARETRRFMTAVYETVRKALTRTERLIPQVLCGKDEPDISKRAA